MQFLAVLTLVGVAAAKVTFNQDLPEYGFSGALKGPSKACVAAYSAEIDCTEHLFQFRNETLGPALLTQTNLEKFCTGKCIRGLNAWDAAVRKACTDEDLTVLEDQTSTPSRYFAMVNRGRHEVQENLFWPFCMRDQRTKKFCVLEEGLPEFPPVDAVSLEVTGEFCYSSCRQQQSYLIQAAAAAAEIDSKIYNSARCPEIDQTSFDMNSYSFSAFGVNVLESAKTKDLQKVDGKLLEGTGYALEDIFQTVLVAGAVAESEKTDGEEAAATKAGSTEGVAATQVTESDESSAISLGAAKWGVVAVAGVAVALVF